MADVLMLYNYFMVVRWQRERCFLLCLCTVNLLSASLLSLGNTQVNLVLLSLNRKLLFPLVLLFLVSKWAIKPACPYVPITSK